MKSGKCLLNKMHNSFSYQ